MDFNATFIIAFISFIVFIIIMNQILYKPINDIVEKRKNFIDENYNQAEENTVSKETILKEKNDKIKICKKKIKEKTSHALQNAHAKKSEVVAKYRDRAKSIVKEETQKFHTEEQEAKKALNYEIVNLAQMISDKFISSDEKIAQEDLDLIINKANNQ